MKQVFGGITGDSSDITAGDSIIGITNYLCYSGTVQLHWCRVADMQMDYYFLLMLKAPQVGRSQFRF